MTLERAARKHGSNEVEIVEFNLGGQSFGLNISKVREFVPFDQDKLTSLPNAPMHMPGVFVLRGRTIPVIDLRAYLEIPPDEESGTPVVLVSEYNQRLNGLITDGINKIHRLPWDRFQPVHKFLGGFQAQVLGSINVDGKDVFVLDLESILGLVEEEVQGEEGAGEKAASDAATGAARSQAKLVMAEDSKVIQKRLVGWLNNEGYSQVEAYSNGQEAWQALVALAEEAEAGGQPLAQLVTGVVSDIEMPAMDGLTLVTKIRAHPILGELKVIMFSSLINEYMAKRCAQAGANAWTIKPNMADLVDLIDKHILAEIQ